MPLYEMALMGEASDDEIAALEACLSTVIAPSALRLGTDVGWTVRTTAFVPSDRTSAVAAFFGKPGASSNGISDLLARRIPIIPVAQSAGSISADLPNVLKPFNCLTFNGDGVLRIATAMLECVGLLPRQRRVFVSYRRDEAKEAALQVFNHLSGKVFEVFLDTHGILPAEDFQGVLWHKLCDSDVLIMLDTPTYFESRWTSAEFGRALSKGISILRVEWPGVIGSRRTATTSRLSLDTADIDLTTGKMTEAALGRIAAQVEAVRAQSHAIRNLNLFSALRRDIECVGGTVTGVGVHNAISACLADGREIVIYPTLGVPTSMTLNEVTEYAAGKEAAILYDHLGLGEQWLRHLKWLGKNISAARWVRTAEAAWEFGGWGTP